ncbi:hypothetical protein [Bosea thiooxidans]
MKLQILVVVAAVLSVAAAQGQPSSTPKEGAGPGSGSTGMAPQQGTGSGATQHSPGVNRPEASHTPGTDTRQNREYGRETTPEGRDLHQGRRGEKQ